jgi:hypothetical protein
VAEEDSVAALGQVTEAGGVDVAEDVVVDAAGDVGVRRRRNGYQSPSLVVW